MRSLPLDAAQHEGAVIARRCEVVRNTCLIQVIEIFVGLLRQCNTVPNSCQHNHPFPLWSFLSPLIIMDVGEFSLTTTIGRERSEYRLQPVAFGSQALPTEVGTLNARVRWL